MQKISRSADQEKTTASCIFKLCISFTTSLEKIMRTQSCDLFHCYQSAISKDLWLILLSRRITLASWLRKQCLNNTIDNSCKMIKHKRLMRDCLFWKDVHLIAFSLAAHRAAFFISCMRYANVVHIVHMSCLSLSLQHFECRRVTALEHRQAKI